MKSRLRWDKSMEISEDGREDVPRKVKLIYNSDSPARIVK